MSDDFWEEKKILNAQHAWNDMQLYTELTWNKIYRLMSQRRVTFVLGSVKAKCVIIYCWTDEYDILFAEPTQNDIPTVNDVPFTYASSTWNDISSYAESTQNYIPSYAESNA
jgi:hypothetical protein